MKKLLFLLLVSCNKSVDPIHTVTVKIETYQNSVYHIVMSEYLPEPAHVFVETQEIEVAHDTKFFSSTVPHIQKIIYFDKNTVFTWK